MQLFKNFASAAITAPVSPGDTTITIDVTRADRLPVANTGTDPVNTPGQDWFKLVLQDVNDNTEIVYVRTRTLGSGVLSNVIRAREGTVALSFPIGSVVGLRVTAKDLEDALAYMLSAGATGLSLLGAETPDDAQGTIGMTTTGKALATAISAAAARGVLGALGASDTIDNALNLTGSGTISDTTTVAATGTKVGYRNVPSNAKTEAYILALADDGKGIDTTANVTVPPNADVALPIGFTVVVTNTSSASISVVEGSGVTLRQAGTANTGTRALAGYGMATLRKVATNTWIVAGSGLS